MHGRVDNPIYRSLFRGFHTTCFIHTTLITGKLLETFGRLVSNGAPQRTFGIVSFFFCHRGQQSIRMALPHVIVRKSKEVCIYGHLYVEVDCACYVYTMCVIYNAKFVALPPLTLAHFREKGKKTCTRQHRFT